MHLFARTIAVTFAVASLPSLARAQTTQTFWNESVTPTQTSTVNPKLAQYGGVELGTTFQSSAAGSIVGLNFYKSPGETGTDVGNLWDATGKTLLGTVTFTNETASGWQTANFAAPIVIQPNTSYVISYHVNANYAQSDTFLPKSPPLKAGVLTASVSNGVYQYGRGGFSNTTSPAAVFAAQWNYFADPIFAPAPSGPAAPAQAVAAGFSNLHFDTEFSTGLNVSSTGPWYNPGVWYQAVGRAPSNANDVLNLLWNPGDPGSGVTVGTMKSTGTATTSFQYGYIEASMAFTPTGGEWPAIWMESNTATTSYVPTAGAHSYGELDIFEWQSQIPTTFNGTIHDWEAPAGQQVTDRQNNDAHNTAALPSGTDLANFNTYGVLWTPTQVSWYFNNQLMLTATSTSYPSAFSAFNAGPMYLMLSNQVGTNWRFGNSPPTSSVDMTVQWVHVWGQ